MYWQTGFRARQRDRKLLRIMKSHGISHLKPSYYGNYYYTHAFPKGPILHRAVGKVLLLSMVTYLGLQIAWTKLDMEERNKDIEGK